MLPTKVKFDANLSKEDRKKIISPYLSDPGIWNTPFSDVVKSVFEDSPLTTTRLLNYIDKLCAHMQLEDGPKTKWCDLHPSHVPQLADALASSMAFPLSQKLLLENSLKFDIKAKFDGK